MNNPPGHGGNRPRSELEARFMQAVQLHGMGRWNEAAAIYRDILRVAPQQPDTLRMLGTLHLQRNEHQEAIRLFNATLAVNPRQVDAAYNRGIALQGLGQFTAAIASYDQAIALEPGNSAAHNNRALVLHHLNRFEESLAACDRAIAANPRNIEAHNNRGRALQSLNRLDEAMRSYDRAIELEPRYVLAHNNRGVVLQIMKRNDAALAAFRRVVELDPGNSTARHLVAALSGATPKSAPADYVARLFDEYAGNFDRHLQAELNYQMPKKMRAVFDRACPGRRMTRTVDLGCGTGLSGEAFRDVAGHLVGIDLSREMLAKARAKNIYRELIEGDLAPSVAALREPAELYLAADVFVYVGDLGEVFGAVARKSTPQALFCFSVEAYDGADYVLRDTGRFAHSRSYIERVAAAAGFTSLSAEDTEIRTDKTGPIMGTIHLLQRQT